MSSDLNLHQMNHFVLSKQHLTDETKSNDIIQIVKDIAGLHATSPTTPYLSLFSRTRNFTREKLDEELYAKRNLGKIRYVRKTVYIIQRDMIPTAFAATKRMVEPASENYCRYLGVTKKEYEKASNRVMEILKGRRMTTREISKELQGTLNYSPILNLMCDQGLLIRGPPEKGWKSNIHTYYRFDEYFPGMNLNVVEEAEARKSVVKQYLASFGPATENDASWWTGFPKSQVKGIIESLEDEITFVEVSGISDTHLILSSEKKSLTSAKPPVRHVVNILPGLDPYLMGYKDRDRYLNREHYSFVFDRSGNATSTILLNGQVIGVWDFEEPLVKIFLFNTVETKTLKEIHAKAKSIGVFISGKEVKLKECRSMTPLTQRTAGAVMTPLKNAH